MVASSTATSWSQAPFDSASRSSARRASVVVGIELERAGQRVERLVEVAGALFPHLAHGEEVPEALVLVVGRQVRAAPAPARPTPSAAPCERLRPLGTRGDGGGGGVFFDLRADPFFLPVATTATSEIDSSTVGGCLVRGRTMVMQVVESTARPSDRSRLATTHQPVRPRVLEHHARRARPRASARAPACDDSIDEAAAAPASAAARDDSTGATARATPAAASAAAVISPTMRASRHKWPRIVSSVGASWNARR